MKGIRKSLWSAYWKLHDKRKKLVGKFKGYLNGLPQKTRKRIVLVMFAAFATLALYIFGKAVHDLGSGDGGQLEIDHAGQVELSMKPDKNDHFTTYYNDMYGTDEE